MAARRIVLLGASGYLGAMVATALAQLKVRPLLVGPSAQNLAALGAKLGHGLDTAVVDLLQPDSVDGVIGHDDVVVNMAGPFLRYGRPAVEAAIQARALYLDCATEPAHIRAVFEEFGPIAAQVGVALVPAFGHEYVAGNLAAALVLERTGAAATRLDVGYFATGPRRGSLSVGSRSSRAGAAMAPQFAWRDGGLQTTTFGDEVRAFDVGGVESHGVAVGGSEHIAIPRMFPSIREVGVYTAGPRSVRVARRLGGVVRRARRIPPVPPVVRWVAGMARTLPGPGVEARGRSGSVVLAAAYDSGGRNLGGVRLTGVDRYTFTAQVLTWAALRAAAGWVVGEGALGPAEAFGLSGLREACASQASIFDEPGEEAESEPGYERQGASAPNALS